MTLPPSFKYFISVWKSTQPNERTLTNLILKPIEERRTEKRAENIAFIANKHQCKKNFKKSNVRSGVCHYCHKTLDQGMQKPKSSNTKEKYTGRKGEALIETVFAEYNLETSSDVWHMDSDAIEHMSNHREWLSYKKFDTVKNIKIGRWKIFKQWNQEISTFLFSMEKNGCEIILVIFFTYQN